MDEDRIHGVGLAIKSSLMKQLPTLPIGINERLMKLRLPLGRNRYATIISAYAPTLTSPEETIEQFYANLISVLDSVPANDKLILLGDFIARVGHDHSRWEGVLGRHSERQRSPTAEQMYRIRPGHHQHSIQNGRQVQDLLDAPKI